MEIAPFATEQYFALYEFTTPYLLSASDCETMSIGELLKISGVTPESFAQTRLGYTESTGHPDYRAAVARTYEMISAEEVVILTSPVEGIYLAMQTLLEPDDEVVVLAPAYDALINIVEHISNTVHRWYLSPSETGWQIDLDWLVQRLNSKTKLIIVNFPHNPTGFLPGEGQFMELVDIARKHGVWLFCDEMYRGLEHGEQPRLPSAADRYERSIVLSGLSKTHGLPGLRAGWLIIRDEQIRQELINWKHYTSICPAAPTEFLSVAALDIGETLAARNRETIRQNLSLAESFFAQFDDLFIWRRPQAGSVALVGIKVDSATRYCHELARSAGVLLLPAAFMGYDDKHVRFGFGRKSYPTALKHYEKHLLDPEALSP